MYIDFKWPKGAIYPFQNSKLRRIPYEIVRTSTYQFQIKCDDKDGSEIRRLLKRCHYQVLHVYPDEMARSTDYRRRYFASHPRPEGGYRCLYCNRKLSDTKIEIDHIFPVHKAKTKAGQRYLKRHGMRSVNDPKNLAAACHRCNRNKSAKTGIWLLRAKLGTHKWYWIIRNIIMVLLVCAIVGLIFYIRMKGPYLTFEPYFRPSVNPFQ